MNKVLIGVIITAAILIGIFSVLSYENNFLGNNNMGNKSENLNATGKHYSVNLTESVGIRAPGT